jgi:hypothetical protein
MLIGSRTYKNAIGLVPILELITVLKKMNGSQPEKWNPMDIFLVDKSTVDGLPIGEKNGKEKLMMNL